MQLKNRIKNAEEKINESFYPNYSAQQLAAMTVEELEKIAGATTPEIDAAFKTLTDDELHALLADKRHLIAPEKLSSLNAAYNGLIPNGKKCDES